MNRTRTVSILFSLLGILLLIGGLLLCWFCTGSSPLLLQPSENAIALTESFTESLRSGDTEASGSMLLGQPRLAFDPPPESSITALLWYAYTDSLQFSFQDSLSSSKSGCCRTVTVTGLDIPALMQRLKEAAPELLAQETALIGEDLVFGKDNHYRQDVVSDVLYRGVQQLLSGPYPIATREYQLELVLQDNVWKIMPNQDLLDLICGKIA